MEGTPFGRYRLVELLGRGGMGEVWRAQDTETNNRTVAIKVLPPHLADDATFAQRFRREADAVARLNNPHIIPIHTYGQIDGRLFVDMRLIEGRDLQQVLNEGPLDAGRAVRIIEQVAKALHAAHKEGLVHRDVKPSNVLLDDDDFAYLIDFGIARAADDTRMTGTGNAIGTFQYMAPERMHDHADDARTDIYALACVLYECLTGQPPFTAGSLAGLVAAHLNAPPPRPSRTKPDVPATFDSVIAKGMAKKPGERYATTIDLARDATEAAGEAGPTVSADFTPTQQARPPSTDQRITDASSPTTSTQTADKLLSGRRIQVAVAGGVVALVIVIATVAGILMVRAEPEDVPGTASGPAASERRTMPSSSTGPTSASTTKPPSPPPVVDADGLPGLLPSLDELKTIMDNPELTAGPNSTGVALPDPSQQVYEPADCASSFSAGAPPAYEGTGWRRFFGVNQAQSPTPSVMLGEAVVTFDDAAAAQKALARYVEQWRRCANTQFTWKVIAQGQQAAFTLGEPVDAGGGVTSLRNVNPGSPVAVTRAIAAKNNVLVDVQIMGSDLAEQNVTIAQRILQRIPS